MTRTSLWHAYPDLPVNERNAPLILEHGDGSYVDAPSGRSRGTVGQRPAVLSGTADFQGGTSQAIKIATPIAVQTILDKAIQLHGAGGLSQDFPLASAFATIRTLRLVDGPDEVHLIALARAELRRQAER